MCGVQGEHCVALGLVKNTSGADQGELRVAFGPIKSTSNADALRLPSLQRAQRSKTPKTSKRTEETERQSVTWRRGGRHERRMAAFPSKPAKRDKKGPHPSKAATRRARTNQTKFKGCRIVGVGGRPKNKTTDTQFKGWPVRGVGAASDRIGTPREQQAQQRSLKGGRESSLRSGWDTRGRAEQEESRKDRQKA